jgi:hypothetical protein
MSRRAPGVVLFVLTAVFGWVAAVWLVLNAPPPAEAAQVRSVSTTVVYPTAEGWQGVTFHMLLLDDGSVPFEEAAARARDDAVARVPGGIELEPGKVSAQFNPLEASWAGNTTSWSYNPANAPAELGDVFPIIASGASAWNQAGNADWRFQPPGTTGASPSICDSVADGQNTVAWGSWPGQTVLAVTCIRGAETLIEFDMLFVTDRAWTTDNDNVGVDLASVAAHEFGHALGLDHSADSSSLMTPNYPRGRIRREPQDDDVAGLIALYGSLPLPPTPPPAVTPTPTAIPTIIPVVDPLSTGGSETPASSPSPVVTLQPATPSPTPASMSPAATATPTPERILIPGLARN